jgi:CPA1 family monovalent cation:H+ antiporter
LTLLQIASLLLVLAGAFGANNYLFMKLLSSIGILVVALIVVCRPFWIAIPFVILILVFLISLRFSALIELGVLFLKPISHSLRVRQNGRKGWPCALMPSQCGGMACWIAFLKVVWTHSIYPILNHFRCRMTNTKSWLVIDCHGC